jgi:effector-binding domain-containing protein
MIDVQLKTTEPETVAFIAMNGPYDQIPQAMGQLYRWVGECGLEPVGMPESVFLTDPAAEPVEIAWEVRTPVAGAIPDRPIDANRCGVKHVDPHMVAFAMHRGEYETVGRTYGELMSWVEANGYEVMGPPEELYYSDPATTAPADYLTEIRFPVAKK